MFIARYLLVVSINTTGHYGDLSRGVIRIILDYKMSINNNNNKI